MTLGQPNSLEAFTQYELPQAVLTSFDVPDVVPTTPQTADSACQHEVPAVESDRQHGSLEYTPRMESSTQYDSQSKDSFSQHEIEHANGSTQHDIVLRDVSTTYLNMNQVTTSMQHAPQVADSHCQHAPVEVAHSSSQYIGKSFQDRSCQHSAVTAESSSQYDVTLKQDAAISTHLQFSMDNACEDVGRDTYHNIDVLLTPVVTRRHQATMANILPCSVDQSIMTLQPSLKQCGTLTEARQHVDAASDSIRTPSANKQSQTTARSLCDGYTNTQTLPVYKDSEANTDSCPVLNQTTQTIVSKYKSRGVSARPSLTDCGIEVKPCSSNVFTNTIPKQYSDFHSQTSTVYTRADKSTATLLPVYHSRGVTAHSVGIHNHTSTADLVQVRGTPTQTQHNVTSVAVGSDCSKHSVDDCTSTGSVGVTVACGMDTPLDGRSSVAVGTMTANAQRDVAVHVGAVMSDSWTNPVHPPVSSKACGTEKVRHRNVGLYVRPSSKDGSSMTDKVKTIHASCGDGSPRLQSSRGMDTSGLIVCVDTDVNTDGECVDLVTTVYCHVYGVV